MLRLDLIPSSTSIIAPNPMYHQIAFGSIQLFAIARIIYLIKYRLPPSSQHPAKKTISNLIIRGVALFVAAFVVWNLDNIFCDMWRDLREKVAPFGFLIEGHGKSISRTEYKIRHTLTMRYFVSILAPRDRLGILLDHDSCHL